MAIQIPNPGTGNGATGDNEFVLWSKVKDNFSNKTHAASRLVGTSNGNVPELTAGGIAGLGLGGFPTLLATGQDLRTFNWHTGFFKADSPVNGPSDEASWWQIIALAYDYPSNNYVHLTAKALTSQGKSYECWKLGATAGWQPWRKMWNQGNTTTDSNGFIKSSSPVLQIFAESMTVNTDAELMQATYTRNGVGDYTISGTTGLRSDGWYITIPNDMNGNPKVAIGTLDDTDGVITLKTYVCIFDMTSFKFAPDLEQPLDIPDGRWIDLRFNDLPEELIPQEV